MAENRDNAGKRRALGVLGEDAATRYLEALGWSIWARNWRCPYGEIDIVAQDESVVVFVEVRARRDGNGGPDLALASIGPRKQEQLLRLAEYYASSELSPGVPVRLDVVGVAVAPDGRVRIEHVRDAVDW
ncbi:MAG: YraN family protein [Chloroflexi bacterium]|nr:YraN family protein [Chloroflexota bacterium]